MFIDRIRKEYQAGDSIFAENILSLFPEYTKAYVYRLIKEAIKNNYLKKFSRGIYYIPKKTVLGYSSPTSSFVADYKYVKNGSSTYGIYSGLTLLNEFAITSQVPNVVEIVTNKEATRKRTVNIDGVTYILRKSRFEINSENSFYYSILQLFLELGINPNISSFSKERIKKYIDDNNIDKTKLFKLATKFPAQTLKNLISSEIIYGLI